jgi:hypothetical protein
MTDNTIKSTDVNPTSEKPAKKATPKKAAPKKADAAPKGVQEGFKIIVFESGSSYVSNSVRFTRDNHIQEVPDAEAELLLALENFRLPDQFEIEEYFNSKED